MSDPTGRAGRVGRVGRVGTAARTPAERAHHGDLDDGPPAPPEGVPLLAVLGSRQAESLRLATEDDDVRTVRVPALHEPGPGDLGPLQRLLPRLDLRHVLVPPVRHAGPYPCHLVVHTPGPARLSLRRTRHGAVVAHDLLLAPTLAHLRTISHPGDALLEPLGRRVRAAPGLADLPTRVTRLLHATRPDVLDVVLARTVARRGLHGLHGVHGLELPA